MNALRNRQTILLVGLFVVVVFVAFALNLVRRSLTVRTPVPASSILYFFPALEPIDITRIEISNQQTKHQLILVKVPGGWTITDEKGGAANVALAQIPRMIQNLATLRYNRVMNTSEVDVTTIGLSNGGDFVVSFQAAGTKHTLHIGAISTASNSSYVQLDSDSAVYLTDVAQIGSLAGLVDVPDATATLTP